MGKYVIYKCGSAYKATTEENYNARLVDERKIIHIVADNFEQCKETLIKWLNLKPEQIVNKTEE